MIFLSLSIIFPSCAKSKTSNASKAPEKTTRKSQNKKKNEDGEANSQKSYPEFVMPPKSKLDKMKAREQKKKNKAKDGYYQEKSDEDDTLEKVESLRVEMSDRTRRAMKKNKKKNA